jgi:hypothetical protein
MIVNEYDDFDYQEFQAAASEAGHDEYLQEQ